MIMYHTVCVCEREREREFGSMYDSLMTSNLRVFIENDMPYKCIQQKTTVTIQFRTSDITNHCTISSET
jgi:hypothetical protein